MCVSGGGMKKVNHVMIYEGRYKKRKKLNKNNSSCYLKLLLCKKVVLHPFLYFSSIFSLLFLKVHSYVESVNQFSRLFLAGAPCNLVSVSLPILFEKRERGARSSAWWTD